MRDRGYSSRQFANVVSVEAGRRHGLAFVFSQADLAALVATIHSIRSRADCSDVTVSDLSIATVVAFASVGDGFAPLDGIVIGSTANTLPTDAFPIPTCFARHQS